MLQAKKATKRIAFNHKNPPAFGRGEAGGMAFRGRAPSRKPAGHRRENQAVPVRRGRSATSPASTG